jgi:hypothetical protein
MLALTGCGSAVAGTPNAGAPSVTGPFTTVLASTPVFDSAGEDVGTLDATPFGHGGAYVVVPDDEDDTGATLHAVPPDGGGLGTVRETAFRQIVYVDDLHATRDGRLVVVGQVDPPDPEDEYSTFFGVAVLDPETGEGPAYDLLDDGYRDAARSVVSTDGRTLYALVAVDLGDDEAIRLLSVDLDSGEITASRDLEPNPGEFGWPADLVLAPDGTVTVELEVSVESVTDDDASYVQLARFGPDLAPRGEPVAISDPADDFDASGLAVTADGTVFALLQDYSPRIVALAPGESEPRLVVESDDYFYDLAVDPAGRFAYTIGGEDLPVAVDLTSGEVGDPVQLCDDGEGIGVDGLGMGRGGGALVVVGYCRGGPETVWRLGPAS